MHFDSARAKAIFRCSPTGRGLGKPTILTGDGRVQCVDDFASLIRARKDLTVGDKGSKKNKDKDKKPRKPRKPGQGGGGGGND